MPVKTAELQLMVWWDIQRDNRLNNLLCFSRKICVRRLCSELTKACMTFKHHQRYIGLRCTCICHVWQHYRKPQCSSKEREGGTQLTNMHRHKPLSEQGAKSIPNTPQRCHLHAFDHSLSITVRRASPESFRHMRAHTHTNTCRRITDTLRAHTPETCHYLQQISRVAFILQCPWKAGCS